MYFNSFMVQLKVDNSLFSSPALSDFNSFMVQLKDVVYEIGAPLVPFQFLHGTIKRMRFILLLILQTIFQFLHGTIKSQYDVDDAVIAEAFQFLHGTIKSFRFLINVPTVILFQFLHGTIKRDIMKWAQWFETNFNSFMVQLKGRQRQAYCRVLWDFNSFMVQLKDL